MYSGGGNEDGSTRVERLDCPELPEGPLAHWIQCAKFYPPPPPSSLCAALPHSNCSANFWRLGRLIRFIAALCGPRFKSPHGAPCCRGGPADGVAGRNNDERLTPCSGSPRERVTTSPAGENTQFTSICHCMSCCARMKDEHNPSLRFSAFKPPSTRKELRSRNRGTDAHWSKRLIDPGGR